MSNPNPKKEHLIPTPSESWRPNEEPLSEKFTITIPMSYKQKLYQLPRSERISIARKALCEAIDKYFVEPKE